MVVNGSGSNFNRRFPQGGITVKLSSSEMTSQLLQELQSQASGSLDAQLALSTSALKEALDNEELLLELLQSVGKGRNVNVEA